MGGRIFELIPKIMGEIGAIGKNGTNTYDNYKFRSIDDVYNKVQPVLAKNGVFFKPTVLESTESTVVSQKGAAQVRIKQKVEYTFYASDGSSFSTIVEGEAIDRADKATNKAMTAALKYMLIQVFCIAIDGNNDADSGSPSSECSEEETKIYSNKIREILKEKNRNEKGLIGHLPSIINRDVKKIEDLHKPEFLQVIAFLTQIEVKK